MSLVGQRVEKKSKSVLCALGLCGRKGQWIMSHTVHTFVEHSIADTEFVFAN